jgi:endoglucanase
MTVHRVLIAAVVATLAGAPAAGCGTSSSGAAQRDASSPSPDASADAAAASDAPGAESGDARDAGRAGLHVSGQGLFDRDAPVRLLGVDHRGTESACTTDAGIFEGPSDSSLGAGIAGWKANAVRLLLNEDCVLGLNGLSPASAGTAYNQHIGALVSLLRSQGLYVILSLSFAAPGAEVAAAAPPMADASHAKEFWSVVGSTFHGMDGVVFDLFDAPFVDATNTATQDPWGCWLHGCTITQPVGGTATWQSAGMQDLVDAVRSVGATNVLLAAGLDHGNDLSGWLAHAPHDPLSNLGASLHAYETSACGTAACWAASVAPVAAQVPVVTTELGEHDCAHGFVDTFMPWADDAGVSYLGSSWSTGDCASGPSLISDYAGTPTAYGEGLKAHLAAIRP